MVLWLLRAPAGILDSSVIVRLMLGFRYWDWTYSAEEVADEDYHDSACCVGAIVEAFECVFLSVFV